MKKISTRPAWSQALALEPRMMFDAAAVATAATVADATASTTAPHATATAATDAVYSIDKSGTLGADTALFSGASVTADSSGNEITKLVVSVSTSGSDQALVVDGTAITLTTGSGETASHYYSYNVAVADGKATITLFLNTADTVTPAAVENLIDGISYRALSSDVGNGSVDVTLTSISDADDSSDIDVSAHLTIDNSKNLAPTLSDTDGLSLTDDLTVSDLNNSAKSVAYSPQGDYAYVASSDGTLLVYSVAENGGLTKVQTLSGLDDLSSVTGMVAGESAVYVLNGGEVITLARASDGTLSESSSTSVGDTAVNEALSTDGKQLYISTQWNGVYVFDVGTDGTLSYASVFTDNVSRSAGLTTAGDYLFVVDMETGQTLSIFKTTQVDGVSTLTLVASATTGETDYSALYQVAATADGKTLYSLNTVDGTLTTWQFNGTTATVLESQTLSGANALTVSGDGSQLYVSDSSGNLQRFAIASSGALTHLDTQSTGGSSALAVSGSALLVVGGDSIERYSTQLTYTLGSGGVALADTLTLADSNSDVLNGGAGNYQDSSITITAPDGSNSQYGLSSANGLSLNGEQLLLNGEQIGTFVASGDTLKVTFTTAVTTAEANQVLHQLLWSSTSVSSALVVLSVVANDGELNSTAQNITVRVNHAPTVDSSVADNYTLPGATSETEYSATLPDLFTDADQDNLTWSVSGLPDGLTFNAETHTISGSTTSTGSFTLTVTATDTTGASTETTLTLAVEQIANRAPEANADASTTLTSAVENQAYSLQLDSTLFSDADSIYHDTLSWQVSGLPEGISFDAATHTLSGTATSLSDNTLTVTVTDSSGATASMQLTLRVISTDEAANHAPTLDQATSSLSYSSDGNLTGYSYYVDNISLSADGETLAVVGATGANYSGTIYVSLYHRDSDGALTLLKTYTQGTDADQVDGLQGTTAVAFSADGKTLYISGTSASGSSVVQGFSVGSDGTLTLINSQTLSDTVLKVALSSDGNSLYAMTGSGLTRYSLDASGTLTAEESFTTEGTLGLAVEGDNVYALNSSGTLYVYSANSSGVLHVDGQLTHDGTALTWTDSDGNSSDAGTLGTSSAMAGSWVSLTAVNGHIYIVSGTNSYLVALNYDASSNSMSLVSSASVYNTVSGYPFAVAASADGDALYVGGNTGKIAVYQFAADGSLTLVSTTSGSGALVVMAISPDGQSVYGGSRLYSGGLRTFSGSDANASVAWTEGSEATAIGGDLVLADSDYDALNNGQGDYQGATLSVTRSAGADSSDSYGLVAANGLALANGVITLNGEAIATFTQQEGALTLTFTATTTTAVANQVLQQISWSTSSKAPGATINLTVTVSDRYVSASKSVVVNVTEVNDPPTLTATAANPTYSDASSSVALFTDTTIDTIESGQLIQGITLTVSGLASGENEYLVIDGSKVSLSDGVRISTNSSLTVSVTVTDGVATVSISSTDGITSDAAQTLVNGVAYGNADGVSGSRDVTLTLIKDNGGTENGGSDSAALDIHSTVTLQVKESAAVIGDSDSAQLDYADSLSAVSGLGTLTLSQLSSDGSTLFVTDGSGTVAVFSRDSAGKLSWLGNSDTGLSAITAMAVTADGSTLLVASDSGSTLAVFSRSSDGKLTEVQSITAWNTTAIVLSGDGTSVYVTDSYNALTVYSLNSTGLTAVQTLSYDAWSEPVLFTPTAIYASGDWLYVVTDPVSSQFANSLIVYHRGSDGQLTLTGVLHDGSSDVSGTTVSIAAPTHVTSSSDGSLIYVASGSDLLIYSLNQTTGKLVQVADMQNIGTITAMAMTSDDSTLYLTLDDGSLHSYQISASGNLTALTTLTSSDYAGLSGASYLFTSSDGGVVAGGAQLVSFSLEQTQPIYTPGTDGSYAFSSSVTVSDKTLDSLNAGAGDYGNATLTVSDSSGKGSFGFSTESGITLASGGELRLGEATIGSWSEQNGVLSITFSAGVTTATASQVLANLTWQDSDTSTPAQVTLSISLSSNGLVSNSWQQAITINHAPEAEPDNAQTITVTSGQAVSITLPDNLFSDADGDSLSWTLSGLPDGLSFDAATHTISGTTTVTGDYALAIVARDALSASATLTLTLSVTAATGDSGGSGDSGNSGDGDNTGGSGDSGNSGNSGDTGGSGDSGNSGNSGDTGGSGDSGNPGNSGDTGGSGDSGNSGGSQPGNSVNPVILPATPAFTAPVNSTFMAMVAAAPDSMTPSLNTLIGGAATANTPLDYSQSPWQLDPIMPGLLPTLEVVHFRDHQQLAEQTRWQGSWQHNAQGERVFQLPAGLQGRSGFTGAVLANGRPLPSWLRFDARHGEVRITHEQHVPHGQIQLRLQRADGTTLLLTLREGKTVASVTPGQPDTARIMPPVEPVQTQHTEATMQHVGVSQALQAQRGDGNDLLQALNALAAAQPLSS